MHEGTKLHGAKIARKILLHKDKFARGNKIARRQICTKGQFCKRVKQKNKKNIN